MRAENWLFVTEGMESIDGVNQVFARLDGNVIKLLVIKVVDEFLIDGRTGDIKRFLRELSGDF